MNESMFQKSSANVIMRFMSRSNEILRRPNSLDTLKNRLLYGTNFYLFVCLGYRN